MNIPHTYTYVSFRLLLEQTERKAKKERERERDALCRNTKMCCTLSGANKNFQLLQQQLL